MPGLYDWYLVRYQGALLAQGVVYGHPTLSDGMFIHTSPIREIEEEEAGLVLMTHSGNRYVLRPEEVDPGREEDILSSLEALGIGTGFVENYLRARREADARIQEEEERLVGPGELLLAVVGNNVIRALFRDEDGTAAGVNPGVGMEELRESVRVTDWNAGRVDFRYYLKGDRIEPTHISAGPCAGRSPRQRRKMKRHPGFRFASR